MLCPISGIVDGCCGVDTNGGRCVLSGGDVGRSGELELTKPAKQAFNA